MALIITPETSQPLSLTLTGISGPAGKNAYQLWLAAGHAGTETDYLASLVGRDGVDGVDGRDGLDGVGRLKDNIAVVDQKINFGSTPGDVRYGMNSGFQSNPNNPTVQIASVGDTNVSPLIETFRFNNDAKPNVMQIGKSRGDGIVGSPTLHRKSLAGDRLGQINFYGSSDYGFSHAAYIFVNADADNNIGNEVPALLRLQVSNSNPEGSGSGMILNSRGNTFFPGPAYNEFAYGVDHKAVVKIGTPTSTMVPLALTPSPLKTTPVAGAVECDATGKFYVTDATTNRKPLATYSIVNFTQPTTPIPGASISFRYGSDYIEATLTNGPTDFTNIGTIVRTAISPTMAPATPIVIGSYSNVSYVTATTNPPIFGYSGSGNRLIVEMFGGVLKANQTYIFSIMFRFP